MVRSLRGTNLLGGRARQLTMFPFVPEELGHDFRLERALRQGTVPLVWDSKEPDQTLVAYVRTYLKEEIQAEAVVRNLPGFARFLPVAGLMHGQSLNKAHKTEVDFVLLRGREKLAVEVKATRALRPDDQRGLRAIAELRGLVRRVLVFLGPRPLRTPDGIDVLPFDMFTQALAQGALWP